MDRYVTFGQKYAQEPHPVLGPAMHPNGWLRVTNLPEDDEVAARMYLFRMLGTYWAFDYTEEPDAGTFVYGELAVLDFDTDRIRIYESERALRPGFQGSEG